MAGAVPRPGELSPALARAPVLTRKAWGEELPCEDLPPPRPPRGSRCYREMHRLFGPCSARENGPLSGNVHRGLDEVFVG